MARNNRVVVHCTATVRGSDEFDRLYFEIDIKTDVNTDVITVRFTDSEVNVSNRKTTFGNETLFSYSITYYPKKRSENISCEVRHEVFGILAIVWRNVRTFGKFRLTFYFAIRWFP